MTFFSVDAAEEAVNAAIAGLEAKGWQSEIVDPDSMGASRPRAAARLGCAHAARAGADEDEDYEEEEEQE